MENQISRPQAWAIATVLNQAGMDVDISSWTRNEVKMGPLFIGATGTQVVAAAAQVIREGGHLSEGLAEINWLMVAFEEHPRRSAGTDLFSSAELVWKV